MYVKYKTKNVVSTKAVELGEINITYYANLFM